MSVRFQILIFSLVSFVLFSACNESNNVRSWIGSYYYDCCCDNGASSEYWNLVLSDSSGHVSALLYFGAGSEKAVLHCDAVGDSLHLDVHLSQKSSLTAFNAIAVGDVLFSLNRQSDSSIQTVWKAAHPQCSSAKPNEAVYFTSSQPGTINDPCAGENTDVLHESDQIEEDEELDFNIDTAELRIAWNGDMTQASISVEARQLLQAGVKVQASKSFDEAHLLTKLSDKNIETADCFAVEEGGSVSLHLKQPLPLFIITGSDKSADGEYKSRIKSIDIMLEFEKIGHIELLNNSGIQYLKQFEELRSAGSDSGLEIEMTAYPTSKEVCISELF